MVSLNELELLDKLTAARKACDEIAELVDQRDDPTSWLSGRKSGMILAHAEVAEQQLMRLIIGLEVRLRWGSPSERDERNTVERESGGTVGSL